MPVWLPYCGSAPDPGHWLARWNFDPVLIIVAIALLGLGWWKHPATLRSQSCATALFAVIFISPLCALGSALFSIRAVHHLLLTLALAPLLVAAIGERASTFRPGLVPTTVVQAGVFWAWHFNPLYELALSNDAVFWAMQASITLSAMAWWLALGRAASLVAAASTLATTIQMGLLGALLVFAGRPFYAPHWFSTQVWGLSPIEDQQIAGLVIWVLGSGAYLAIASALIFRALTPSPRPAVA
ncbi:putative membrane protein [Novosphingobium hassiacum]|uniref:Putative membrane protein n=1 Tax=Novosphingobium hassiacum TaxID=173676 RepID=A0A7W5ZY19_9SPHN|nr:cytochrome c oxidase assembly protein [Novosphingobium hassiacum]MBB3860639.1 putative membrane protein [Novosphingobium hassiacum]